MKKKTKKKKIFQLVMLSEHNTEKENCSSILEALNMAKHFMDQQACEIFEISKPDDDPYEKGKLLYYSSYKLKKN